MILTRTINQSLPPCGTAHPSALLLSWSSHGSIALEDSPATTRKSAEGPPKCHKVGQLKKAVRFADHFGLALEEIHLVMALSDITKEENESVWLTRHDRQVMEEALRLDVIRSSFRHHQTDLDESPLRGLEWKTFEGIQQRNEKRKKGLDCVLKEQNRQGAKGVIQTAISEAYRQAASLCVATARIIAVEDARIASRILQEVVSSSHEEVPHSRSVSEGVAERSRLED
jgi:hypothetical protein